MKKLVNKIFMISGIAFLFAACQPDNLVETPEFTVTDGSGTEILSMTSSENYRLILTADEQTTSTSQTYTVRSNVDWRLEAAEESQDWCRPFPDHGSDDGVFRILAEANNDQTAGRTAYYDVIINDGINETRITSMFVVEQAANVDFLRTSAATLEISKEETAKQRIVITSNVEWNYTLVPDSQYATADLSWLEDVTEHPVSQKIDTIVLNFADNTGGTIRGAVLTITPVDESLATLARTIPISQMGEDVEVTGFPVQWIIGTGPENVNFNSTFPNAGYIEAVSGGGRITYVEGEGKTDPDAKFTRVVGSGGDPYVTGAWPGDYWEFKSDSPVSAGTILQIKFQAATSATGHKFWRLEYRDGDQWIVPESLRKTTTVPGSEIVYTHIMQPSSSSKVDVQATVKLNNTTDAAHFRLVCAANWQSSGNGALSVPNGGTMRLSLADNKSSEWQPKIACVAAGAEDLTPANITVSGIDGGIITFEGDPGDASATFTVVSDTDFKIVPSVSWLHATPSSGIAGESVEVTVTCDPSDLAQLRRGTVDIKAGITTYSVNVVQSAAGGELEPLISVIGGNKLDLDATPYEGTVRVQANVAVTATSDADWLTVTAQPQTKALVETAAYTITATQNWAETPRTGHITFSNQEEGIESVLTVTQKEFKIAVTSPAYIYVPSTVASHEVEVVTNAPLTVTSSADWLSAGSTDLAIGTHALVINVTGANSTTSRRTAEITLANTEGGFSQTITVIQSITGTVFSEDFEWLEPWAAEDNSGRTVETDDLKATANLLKSVSYNGVTSQLALQTMGYELLKDEGSGSTIRIYLQRNYLKFGKTGDHSGLAFPKVSLPSGGKYALEFDWCPMRQGSGKVDPVNLIVTVTNGEIETQFEVPTHGWENDHVLEWINASVDLSSVTIDENTTISITQKEWGAGTANRWFLDNVKLIAK